MSQQDERSQITVESLIELATETTLLPPNTKAWQLAAEIRSQAVKAGYLQTPDGWFVPISMLLRRVEDVADFLHAEMVQYGELEIVGGFRILPREGESPGIPLSADFRSAMTLAKSIISLRHEDRVPQIFVGAQEIWTIALHNDTVKIQIRQMAAQYGLKEFHFPARDLKRSFESARAEVEELANKLGQLLLRYQDGLIVPQKIRWIFGLDKLSDSVLPEK